MDDMLFWFLLCGFAFLFVCGVLLYTMIQNAFDFAKLAHERIDLVLQCIDLMNKQADKDDDKRGGTDERQQ